MLIIFLIYISICLYGIKFCANGNDAYLSIDTTTSIKGIFILLVFFSHFNSYTYFSSESDLLYFTIVKTFGQTMVTLFLFYSGYGVMEAIQKKGIRYIDSFPVKRILATLFRFDCAVLLFLIIGLIFNSQYTFKQVLLSLIGWDTLGNSNWYIFVILVLYLITYFVFKLIKTEKYFIPVIAIAFAICVLIVACWYFNIKPIWWYDTALCYVVGMFFSLLKPYFKKLKSSLFNGILWFVSLGLIIGFFRFTQSAGNTLFYLASNVIFAIMVVWISMYIQIGNKILYWCGNNLFELYILQRIPMIILQHLGIDKINIYLYFIFCCIFTFLLINPFKYLTNKLWGLFPFK